MSEQLALDLFPRYEPDTRERWLAWLREVRGVAGDEYEALFDKITEMFGLSEACERSKTFDCTWRYGLTVDELKSVIGVLSADDYHICWDRAWALSQGLPKECVRALFRWSWATKDTHGKVGGERMFKTYYGECLASFGLSE